VINSIPPDLPSSRHVSRYRIRAVAELTGVSTATLRAWERRYGVPTPSRTASAYRLYGDDDVALIAQMRDLVESGVAPAEAARALRERALGQAEAAGDADAYQMACRRMVDAALRLDVEAIREEVSRALALGPAIAVYDRTLIPVLLKIDELQRQGQSVIAEEHILSNLLVGRANQLLELMQPVSSARRVVLACFEEEEHVLGLYGTGLHFAAWGYRCVFLGARTPPDAILRVVSALEVDAVALSVTIPPPDARAAELIDAYAAACRGVPWLVGGQGVAPVRSLVEERGGLVGDTGFPEMRRALDIAVRVERSAPPPRPSVSPEPDAAPESVS
jgi:MerR family transcriptional regulator, light-induced transcriptional regulator